MSVMIGISHQYLRVWLVVGGGGGRCFCTVLYVYGSIASRGILVGARWNI